MKNLNLKETQTNKTDKSMNNKQIKAIKATKI